MRKNLLTCMALTAVLLVTAVFLGKRMLETAIEKSVEAYVDEQFPTEAAITESPTEAPTESAITEPTLPAVVYTFSSEEERLLLQIGMAERGHSECKECVALVMRTVLNRVEGEKFASTIRNVIYTEGQFTPVSDGTFWAEEPNELCYEALDMIVRGWDESQGALYYEWCRGESWHSKNLNLLTQHCDMRLYN